MNKEYYLVIFKAECHVVTKDVFSGTHAIANGLRPNFCVDGVYSPCAVELIGESINPGEKGTLRVRSVTSESIKDKIKHGKTFEFREGINLLASCSIVEVESVEKEFISNNL